MKSKVKKLFLRQNGASVYATHRQLVLSIEDLGTINCLRIDKFEKAKYLVHIKDFSLRQQVAKFKCRDHNLMIEVGRHKNIALENRTCTKCSANRIEDEVHLLIDCSAYQNLRQQYMSQEIMKIINNLKDKNRAFKRIKNLVPRVSSLLYLYFGIHEAVRQSDWPRHVSTIMCNLFAIFEG